MVVREEQPRVHLSTVTTHNMTIDPLTLKIILFPLPPSVYIQIFK